MSHKPTELENWVIHNLYDAKKQVPVDRDKLRRWADHLSRSQDFQTVSIAADMRTLADREEDVA